MKKYINDRSSNVFCSQLQSLNTSHINVKMSQDNYQQELDRAIDSIVQAGMEDQPFDLEAFFAPLPDSIINQWDAEEARQARLDAEEQQIRPTHEYTTIWPGRNLHTPVLEIPSVESITMLYENIIAPLDNGFVNIWADCMSQVELPSEESIAAVLIVAPVSTIIPPEEPIAAAQENIVAVPAIAITSKDR